METFIHAYSWINLRFLLQGLMVTVYISIVSIILSFILGLFLGIVKKFTFAFDNFLCLFWITTIRDCN